jgi:hypothetical protein
MTVPMPPMAQDPSVVAGQQIKADYQAAAQTVRGNFRITDIDKAARITEIWNSSNTALAIAYRDLQARRQARLAVLEAQIPVGPNVPDDTSPADAAVLQQAFRATLAEARSASTDQKRKMLVDAESFRDDNLRRAVLTAAYENSELGVLHAWFEMTGTDDILEEWGSLREAIDGRGFDTLWISQALSPIRQPDEVDALPQLVKAADAAATAANAQRSRVSFGNPR